TFRPTRIASATGFATRSQSALPPARRRQTRSSIAWSSAFESLPSREPVARRRSKREKYDASRPRSGGKAHPKQTLVTLADRRRVCQCDGLGGSRVRVLPARDDRPYRSLPGASVADTRHARTGRARERGGHARHADDDRRARGAHLAETARVRADCVRRLGYLLLRLPARHHGLADVAVRLGYSFSPAAPLVGARPGANL